jgi:RNA polymerase sigma factor (sigma-70 family)
MMGKPENKKPEAVVQNAGKAVDIGRMYQEIRSSLLQYASRYFKRPQEAEDVVQEAFVKVLEAQRKREIDLPRRYLFRTTRNISLTELSKSATRLTDTVGDLLPEGDQFVGPSMEEQFEASEKFELFCCAVRQLPTKCRRAYVLRRVYGFSQKEVAERMNISLKTVETHLTKAIARCTEYMDAEQSSRRSQRRSQDKGHYHG